MNGHRVAILAAGVAAAAMAAPAISPLEEPAPGPRFHEALSYPELGVTIGVRHVQGVGYRVVMNSPEGERHLSVAGARRIAREYAEHRGDAEVMALLAKVSAGLKATADQLQAILSKPVVGNA